jgi:maltose phosphorylase
MYNKYLEYSDWSIVEEGFRNENHMSSESIFSLGNGIFGQRGNFEEDYSGNKLDGNYIGGIFYPDKTKVGWWKVGYPNYFAKTVNCPSWIRLSIHINNEILDLNKVKNINSFKKELNMKEGVLRRSFDVELNNGKIIRVKSERFISLKINEVGLLKYSISCLNSDCNIKIKSFINDDVSNVDSNWNEKFLKTEGILQNNDSTFINSKVLKTDFKICSFSKTRIILDEKDIPFDSYKETNHLLKYNIKKNQSLTIEKIGGYISNFSCKTDLYEKSKQIITKCSELGYDRLLDYQKKLWGEIWEKSDIEISGDLKSQQGIRFNIFQLNQTYMGQNADLNVGPKGFTGEKYGGGTYWDTEAYCFPFYLATKNTGIARNLLIYRYNQLDKAILNAEKLGLNHGAALYPMVTVDGEECHNEWEITFEEIHRNISIVMAIKKYTDYTSDYSYMTNMGIEILVAVSRFWAQRVSFSEKHKKYVILGVTGPNEYENNVNNNWYTNYGASWCLSYTLENLENIKQSNLSKYESFGFDKNELDLWKKIVNEIYLPYSKKHKLYMQDDGFEDKELVHVDEIPKTERPLNQNWSWDKILRSPYIKQGDVIQGIYYFENDFSYEFIEKHFRFYEKYTVHESSLSASIHSVIASHINQVEKSYDYFLRSSRLDLDDYNKEVEQGLHITSMAGSWIAIVEGFGGLKIDKKNIIINPKIPKHWNRLKFNIFYKNQILKFEITNESIMVSGKDSNKIIIKNLSDKKLEYA